MVQWTISSNERREQERAAGDVRQILHFNIRVPGFQAQPRAALRRASLRRSPGERSTGPFAFPAHPGITKVGTAGMTDAILKALDKST